MEIALIIALILFFIIAGILGPQRALGFIPILMIMAVLFVFFGYIIVAFFPFILIFLIWNLLTGKNNTNNGRTRTYYYRTSTNAEDFEEFFRRASEQNNGGYYYGGSYGNTNNGSNNYGGYRNYFEDKSKYYKILGIQEGASQEEIKKAFRTQAKLHHPDKYANASQSERDYHERKFKEINEAYEKLSSQ
ncbi:J domain-containing protein [Fusobacterium perfoetens]|uniref:J domain-containing protein n=1 Tax=Fusobacterium perfoetens TaxID=852 RepID=UPI00047FA35D|nr:DnaJ domain-containing protein [Fusobacterium perfoetens]MCI6151860.1 DnaJ domain-containing protein [Fusobacterium perfoetens]MDY3236779.1 DnaJ domain-containing protein [Fusobacterium perfoetens]